MKVRELATHLSVTPDTVRFYTRKKLLKPNKNSLNGYKDYGTKEVHRMSFILSARQLGFSVADVESILEQADSGNSACDLVRRILKQRLEETEMQFEQTKNLRQKMKVAIEHWQSLPNKKPSSEMVCHLIETFND